MRSRYLDFLSVTSWMLVAVCAVTLVFFAFAIPNVISMNRVKDRAQRIQEIRASDDLHEVQQIAVWRTQEEAYVTEAARLLLIISIAALLACIVCGGVNLVQIRRLRKELKQANRQAGDLGSEGSP